MFDYRDAADTYKNMAASTLGIAFVTWTMVLWMPYLLIYLFLKNLTAMIMKYTRRWGISKLEVYMAYGIIGLTIILILQRI